MHEFPLLCTFALKQDLSHPDLLLKMVACWQFSLRLNRLWVQPDWKNINLLVLMPDIHCRRILVHLKAGIYLQFGSCNGARLRVAKVKLKWLRPLIGKFYFQIQTLIPAQNGTLLGWNPFFFGQPGMAGFEFTHWQMPKSVCVKW